MGLRVSDRASGSRGAHAGSMLLRGPAEEARTRASGSGCAQRGVLGCPSGPSEGVGGRGPGRETGPRSEEGRRGGGGLGWVGLLLGFGFSISFPPFYFLFQPN